MVPGPNYPVLLIADEASSAAGAVVGRIDRSLCDYGHDVVRASTVADGRALVVSEPGAGCVILDWALTGEAGADRDAGAEIVRLVRRRSESLPIFLMAERTAFSAMPLEVTREVQEYVWVLEDTPEFIAGRIDFAIRRYVDELLPPFFRELVQFTGEFEYSWHTPGHTGGTAFLKSAVGRAFHSFYGEPLLRTDLSVSVEELGSLLDHSGPVGAAERNAARVFGADMTFFVLNGTSTANQIVGHSCLVSGDVVLADRNCHKSLNYSLTVTGAVPVYLSPTRNGYGIIGPIPARELSADAIRDKIAASPLASRAETQEPVYAVVTNSTYDGLCYDAEQVSDLLGASVPRIHYDEAWYGYARFNPLYRGRFGMHAGAEGGDRPTIYATQSTHKLLAALSQASMIHIKSSDRAPVEFARFNEAYMMHGSTSPFYPMIATLDVSAGMMDGASGRALTDESIDEAITFRKTMVDVARKLADDAGPGWFFGVWQPDVVRDPTTGAEVGFAEAADEVLRSSPECWLLHPGAAWHGFDELGDGYCMLDPIKVTVTTPGIDARGTVAEWGIPAQVVSHFLDSRRITVEKTGDYVILFLFSMGITKGKWGTLIDALLEFKRLYDEDASLEVAIPELVEQHPRRYRGVTLRQLCDEMHAELTDIEMAKLLDDGFSQTPEPALAPDATYRHLVRGDVEDVLVDDMADRVPAVMLVPYPPGIPILMPGERAGVRDAPVLRYLLALQDFDRKYPGFEHDIHGVEVGDDGRYRVMCLRQGVV